MIVSVLLSRISVWKPRDTMLLGTVALYPTCPLDALWKTCQNHVWLRNFYNLL